MVKIQEKILRNLPLPILTDSDLAVLFKGSTDSRYGKTKRLIASNKLIHIRRGLYCLTEDINPAAKIHPFELAQHVYGPSYISLESALSYHQLIPEAVYTITNVSSKRSKEFQTPVGLFTYHHLPTENFYTQVSLIKENGHSFLLANPWKAICDYIYCYKKDWHNTEPLIESLRIEPETLPILTNEEMQSLDEFYQHRRITRFLKGIKNER